MGRAMLNICIVFAQLERETIQKRVTDAYYSRCLKGFHMSGQAQVETEIEKPLDTLTGANATLLAYANKKIEDLDNRRKTLSKAIADLSVETLSSQQIELLSGYLDDWENISFEDKRKAADGLISSISATSDYVKIEWKI